MLTKVTRDQVIETAKELSELLRSWDIPVTRTASVQGETKVAFMVHTELYVNMKEIRQRLKKHHGFVGYVAKSIFFEMLDDRKAHGLISEDDEDYSFSDLAQMTLFGSLEHQRMTEEQQRQQHELHIHFHI